MDEHKSHLLQNESLMFFGRITAGQSHEVTNVLNVINELAGLQGDILETANQGGNPDLEKLKAVTQKIRLQVQRGESIVRSINRFAHSVDSPVAVFDLKEALEQIVHLAQRHAHLGRTVLELKSPRKSIPIETSPFGFRQAVFTCIEMAVAASSEERRVTVSYQVLDREVEIAITSADPIPSEPSVFERDRHLELLVRELGGKVGAVPNNAEPHCFALLFRARWPA
jgi:C4-dicarboxylate-specific signal transduction histidine kinase